MIPQSLGQDEITLPGRFPAASRLPIVQLLLSLLLRSLQRIVISYLIGHEPNNGAACSRYTFSSEVYRRYVSTPPVTLSTRVDCRSTVRNTEV